MPNVPPQIEIIGGRGAAERAYRICSLLQEAFQQTGNYCEHLANTTWPGLEEGLRAEGLDGGGKWSQLVHGGDARKSARYIVAPLYVVQTDLLNAIRSTVTFGNRIRVNYFEAIQIARQARNRSARSIPVD